MEIPARDQQAYADWCADGSAGQMAYMTREPAKRLHPENAFPDAQSVLTLGVSYFQGPFPEKPGAAFGRVARYAWGLDYHPVIMDRLQQFLVKVNDLLGSSEAAFLAIDTKPLLERALAAQAGLGFIGKNTVLIIPQAMHPKFHVGSWVFLAEVLLKFPLEGSSLSALPAGRQARGRGQGEGPSVGCGACTKCLTSCPTDAFQGPFRLRADKCISYLTIENKGWIDRGMRPQIGDWLFGCDVCQEVCPYNARAFETRWPELKSDQGAGPWVSLIDLFSISDEPAFKKQWSHTPLGRPKRRGLLRNACVVAGNSGDERLVPPLKTLLSDAEPIVRGHALWALSRLQTRADARADAEAVLRNESDSFVKDECEDILHA